MEQSCAARFAFLLCAWSIGFGPARADPMIDLALLREVRAFAVQGARAAAPAHRIEIELGTLDPRLRLAPCGTVVPYLPPNTRVWGKSRIGLRCESGPARWNVFLPLTVRAYAPALVATTALPAGAVIGTSDLRAVEIDWAAEPDAPIVQIDAVAGRVLARPVAAGQALRVGTLKPRQWFAGGDVIDITLRGAGFAATARGQALTSGIEGQSARVRTESGRVVSGSPVAPRRIEVLL